MNQDNARAATRNRARQIFVYSIAIVLIITALIKIYSTFGNSRVLDQIDPVLHVRYRYVFLLSSLLETVVAAICCLFPLRQVSCVLVLWLAGNFGFYRLIAATKPDVAHCPCLSSITDLLPVSSATVDNAAWAILIYMLLGSIYFIAEMAFRARASINT